MTCYFFCFCFFFLRSVKIENISGECFCPPGFGGVECKSPCAQGFYGRGCKTKCDCDANNTLSCDTITGKCECKKGWNGNAYHV